jgi:two-component system OmpR family sensor kinase
VVISGSRDEPNTSLSGTALDQLADVPTDGEVHGVDLEGVGSYRVVALDAMTTTTGTTTRTTTVVSGLPTGAIDDAVTNLISVEVFLALLAVLVAGSAALVVVRRQWRRRRTPSPSCRWPRATST